MFNMCSEVLVFGEGYGGGEGAAAAAGVMEGAVSEVPGCGQECAGAAGEPQSEGAAHLSHDSADAATRSSACLPRTVTGAPWQRCRTHDANTYSTEGLCACHEHRRYLIDMLPHCACLIIRQ